MDALLDLLRLWKKNNEPAGLRMRNEQLAGRIVTTLAEVSVCFVLSQKAEFQNCVF